MRILHTADLHYGHSRFLPAGAHIERQQRMSREICSLVQAHHIDVVILAGDIAHRIDLSPEEEYIMVEFLRDLDDLVPWVAIAGNHDRYGKDKTRIDFLTQVKFKQGTIATSQPSWVLHRDVKFILVPYAGHSTESLENAVHKVIATSKPAATTIVVAHEHFEGAVLDSGYVGHSQGYPRIPRIPEVDYWALGDIHLHQAVTVGAWYSGAPIQHTFGEKLPKGVIVLDLTTKEMEFVELTTPSKLITLDAAPEIWDEANYYRIVGEAQVIKQGSPSLIYTDFSRKVEVKLDPEKVISQISDVLLTVGLPKELLEEAVEIHEDAFKKVSGGTWTS